MQKDSENTEQKIEVKEAELVMEESEKQEVAEDKSAIEAEEINTEKVEEEIMSEAVNLNDLKQKEKKTKKSTSAKVKELIKKKDEEIKDLKDQLLRRRAEFDNFRRRMETEKTEFVKYALDKSLIDLLPIIDSFDRALHPDNELEETTHVYDGFTLIYKQLMDFLKKQGVSEIVAISKDFDPHFHQAVAQEVQDGTKPGIVIKEYQKGYLFHKRVLRPSMVVVSE